MNFRHLFVVFVLVAGVGWWLLHSSPEDRVRTAHEQLAQVISKSEDDGATPSIRDVRALRSLFAAPVAISGDAEGLDETYSAEEMVSLIIQVRAAFRTIELTLGEPVIEFPGPDTAIARFTAVLNARHDSRDVEPMTESRSVTSRMQRLDGDWLFSRFELAE